MPEKWGLHTDELTWQKFSFGNIFAEKYHLRRAKVITYQLGMLVGIISSSIGTKILEAYSSQNSSIQGLNPAASVNNTSIIGIMSYNIAVGIPPAFVFFVLFVLDLVWPERLQTKTVRRRFEMGALLVCVMATADAIAMAVIVARDMVYINGVSSVETARLFAADGSTPPLVYSKNGKAIATVVFLWLSWAALCSATVVLFLSNHHDHKHGPFASNYSPDKEVGSNIASPEVPIQRPIHSDTVSSS